MIDKKEIEAFVEEGLTGSDCFVVDVQVKPDNVIVVEIDNEEGVDIDKEVELLTKNGMKLSGILKSADSEKFVVTITKKVKSETSKRKVEVEEDLAFGYDEVKYTKYLIRFK